MFGVSRRRKNTMFWSKTKDLVHKLTKNRDSFITLEDTLLGNVLDGQVWCGKAGNKEIYTKCGSGEPNPVSSFWRAASTRFAEYACGNVTVMLDGEREEPYDSNSFFGSVEVPNLKPTRVARLTVVLVTEKNGNQCNKGALMKLKNMLTQKGIGYACKEVEKSQIEKCIQESSPRGACEELVSN
ncbi:ADP-ribosyl cyclase/cyclic ADP-ribose hydrolase 1-like isoform X2 [Cheilinus undulatus]|uniref:ADP-ribosyl cyclase/cyclic ADP-ribose hydrolase 1-like isoform X2 n=1 Tax=Cheilinus undulatus TaxID=241271 RepID=UPI001BD50515|nr:ADP-ribosyl cyclase/cyclic ADP-ribose hydrolase 1-like isoform X2 [Cheilinus undulatus]